MYISWLQLEAERLQMFVISKDILFIIKNPSLSIDLIPLCQLLLVLLLVPLLYVLYQLPFINSHTIPLILQYLTETSLLQTLIQLRKQI